MSGFIKCNHAYPALQAKQLESSDKGTVFPFPEMKLNEDANLLKTKIETDFQKNNDRMKYLLDTGFMSDVIFILENEESKKDERFNCHKLILATGSKVFNKLFNESNAEKSNEIKINDIKAKDFKNMLKYIYYDDAEVDMSTFTTTYLAAEKYAIRPLTELLANKIKYLNGDEMCILLRQLESSRINNKAFQKEISLKCELDTKRIIDSNEFLNLNADTLKELMLNSILNCKEIDLFNAIMRWSKNRCSIQQLELNQQNLKKILSRFIYLFRYTSFDLKEFADGPGKLKLLNDNELVDLFLHLTLNDKKSSNLSKRLITIKRELPFAFEVHINLVDPNSQNYVKYREETECIHFKTDNFIYLKGLILKNQGDLENNVLKLTIFKRSANSKEPISSKLLVRNSNGKERSRVSTKIEKSTQVDFDNPVLIEPNTFYSIVFGLEKLERYEARSSISFNSTVCGNVQFDFETGGPIYYMEKLVFYKL